MLARSRWLRVGLMCLPLLLHLAPGPVQSPAVDLAKPELFLQVGHTLGISALAVSPNGRWLASAGFDYTVKLWEVASGRELRNLDGHSEPVATLAISRDGRFLASGSWDKTVRIWEVATGRQLRALSHPGRVSAIALSPDGRLLASGYIREDVGGGESGVKIWDLTTGRELSSIAGDGRGFIALAFSPDGHKVLTGSPNEMVNVWDPSSGQQVGTLVSPKDPGVARNFAFSPDGHWSASAGAAYVKKSVQIWDLSRGRKTHTLAGHASAVNAVAFSPDGRLLASASGTGVPFGQPQENVVKLWDVSTGRELYTLSGHTSGVNAVAFSADSSWLASGGFDNTVKIWDAHTGRELRTLAGRSRGVMSVGFSRDGRRLASESDRTASVWEIRNGRRLRTSPPPGDTRIIGPGIFAPGSYLIPLMNAENSKLSVYETATGRETRSVSRSPSNQPIFRKHVSLHAALSPDGRLLALADDEPKATSPLAQITALTQKMQMTSMATLLKGPPKGKKGKELMEESRKASEEMQKLMAPLLRSGGTPNPQAMLTALGPLMGSLTGKGSVQVWEATRQEAQTWEGHAIATTSMAFSLDGHLLATGGMDGKVNLWEIATGNKLRTFPCDAGLPFGNTSIAFSPDGRLLAAGNFDGSITLWEPTSGRMVSTLPGASKPTSIAIFSLNLWIASLAFSSDGRYLASGGWDHTINIWDVAAARKLHTLPGHGIVASLAFTPDERWLVSGSADGGTRFWDIRSGDLIATLVSLSDGNDWLAVTPDGLFDGSPGAWGQILWRFGGNTFDVAPVEIFFNEFFYPGLLAEILSGKRPRAKADLSTKDRRQPQVTLSLAEALPSGPEAVSSRNVRIKIGVVEAPPDGSHPSGSGGRDLRLFRNGSLVRVWHGGLSLDKSGKTVLEATIPIEAGETHLTAYAFNNDNIKSEDARLVLTGAAASKQAGTAYILAVGVNRYANPDFNLNFAVADAQAFAEELRRQQSSLGKFATVQVVSLFDQEATRANLMLALERLGTAETRPLPAGVPAILERLKPAQPGDALFIFFAGHGAALEPRFYLIPHDLGYSGPRTELDEAGSKLIQQHSISDLDLVHAFEKLDAGNIVLVIDACQSGQALEAEEKRRGPMNSKGLAQLAYEKGMYILTAAQGYQAALEAKELGHGLLTYALVEEGMKSPAADTQPRDGRVDVREWLDYAELRVPELQEAKMEEAHQKGREITFVDGEDVRGDLSLRTLQCPRAFYRREPETEPLIIAQPRTNP